MVIIFSHSKVREFLLRNGIVYTYRKMHPKTRYGVRPQIGDDWATDQRCGKKIMDVHITPVEKVYGSNLNQVLIKYVRESGFYRFTEHIQDPVEDWIEAIMDLNPKHDVEGWIYKVVRR